MEISHNDVPPWKFRGHLSFPAFSAFEPQLDFNADLYFSTVQSPSPANSECFLVSQL